MIFPSLKDNVILKPKRKEVITMPGTVLKKLLASGMSADEILEKLK